MLEDLQEHITNLVCECKMLEQQLKKKDEVIEKAVRYIKNNLTIVSILDGKEEYGLNNFKFDYKDLLQILEDKEVE